MNKTDRYPYKDLTGKIIGLAYEGYNELGFGYQEKYYQRAFAKLLDKNQIHYQKELHVPIIFQGAIIGRYFIDFVIDGKVAVEFKIANEIFQRHFKQILGYLESKKLLIGLIVLITPKNVKIKRVINSKMKSG